VTDELDPQVRQALQRRRSSPIVPAVVVFAVIVSGAAYLWFIYGDQVRSEVLAAPPEAPAIVNSEESVSRADFETFKKQVTESLQSTMERLDAQKAGLNRLTDQVASLSAKVDALQGATSSTPAQASVVPAAPVVPPRPAAVARRRKPSAPKLRGPISVGGAPLPPAPPSDR
jgi:hypothetical protein